MTDVTSTPTSDRPHPNLAARLIGVIFAPRDAYTAIAARPTWFGALAVSVVLMAAIQGGFFSTDVGKEAYIEQALSTLRAFGMTVNDQVIQTIEAQANAAAVRQAVSLAIFVPIVAALMAGLLLAIFTAIMGGSATFKQVYAVVAHSTVIGVVQQAFSFPIMYARGDMTSPTRLAVFFPMLDEMGFANYFLSAMDLFYVWSLINVSIGVAVLYKRSTGPVAAVLLGIYVVIAVIIAAVRAF